MYILPVHHCSPQSCKSDSNQTFQCTSNNNVILWSVVELHMTCLHVKSSSVIGSVILESCQELCLSVLWRANCVCGLKSAYELTQPHCILRFVRFGWSQSISNSFRAWMSPSPGDIFATIIYM